MHSSFLERAGNGVRPLLVSPSVVLTIHQLRCLQSHDHFSTLVDHVTIRALVWTKKKDTAWCAAVVVLLTPDDVDKAEVGLESLSLPLT